MHLVFIWFDVGILTVVVIMYFPCQNIHTVSLTSAVKHTHMYEYSPPMFTVLRVN